ncbi:hypothetical protein CDAR_462871 [Caerostris darwini]|uniref:Uncharacterized protein n=1 Tax=Caerostris darwini TaxID=1538125 RepID=A0AAV4Q7F1_9ARAC|nr:hypothetical protein CDAR_462871 [Caerostris darwini]
MIKENELNSCPFRLNYSFFLDSKEQPVRGRRSHQFQLLGQFQAARNIPVMLATFFMGNIAPVEGSQHLPITHHLPAMQRNKELVTIAHINIMGFLNLLITTPRAT